LVVSVCRGFQEPTVRADAGDEKEVWDPIVEARCIVENIAQVEGCTKGSCNGCREQLSIMLSTPAIESTSRPLI
jgi:hypothetical protein